MRLRFALWRHPYASSSLSALQLPEHRAKQQTLLRIDGFSSSRSYTTAGTTPSLLVRRQNTGAPSRDATEALAFNNFCKGHYYELQNSCRRCVLYEYLRRQGRVCTFLVRTCFLLPLHPYSLQVPISGSVVQRTTGGHALQILVRCP